MQQDRQYEIRHFYLPCAGESQPYVGLGSFYAELALVKIALLPVQVVPVELALAEIYRNEVEPQLKEIFLL